MSYKYQTNAFDGASVGYLKYNISPDLTETVAPGETITITGEAYHRNETFGAIKMTLGMANGMGYIQAVFPRTITKGKTTQFTLTYTLPDEVLDRMGDGRTLVSALDFGFLRGAELTSGGIELTPVTEQTITILRYRLSPVITAAKFSRCRETDAGWERWDEGLYVLTDSLQAQISASADVSDVTVCRVEYAGEDGESTVVELDPAALIAGYSEPEPVLFAGVEFLLGRDYAFTLKLGDAYDMTEIAVTIPRAFCNFHLSGAATGGAAFGMFSGSADGDPKLESAYPIHAYAGVHGADGKRLDEVQEYTIEQFDSRFQAYGAEYQPVAVRVGRLVQLTGAVKPTASISGSATEYTMFTLPRAFWPKKLITQICQGSTYYQWQLSITTTGEVRFSRYRAGGSYSSAATSALLAFHAVWFASDSTGAVFLSRPSSAMSGASSAGCVASASSEYSSSYAAWRAFNKSYSDAYGWANADSDSAPWLQLQMDVALTNISVTLMNRTRSSGVNGPVAGTVLGSNDGSAWTTLKTFSGFDGTTSGGVAGTVTCGNSAAYRYVRIAFTGWAGGGRGMCVGEATITGELLE